MTDDHEKQSQKNKNYTIKDAGMDICTLTAMHPVSLVKNSIQLGHRPFPDYEARDWLLYKTASFRCGFFPHISHIYGTHGFRGLFTGLTPRVSAALLFNFSRPIIADQVDKIFPMEDNQINIYKDEADEILIKMSKKCLKKSLIESLAIAIQYPLHLIAIRAMAQIIHGEDAYDNLLGSFIEIKENEGLAGFFKGLAVKLLGTVARIWLVEVVSIGIKKCVQIAKESADEDSLEPRNRSEWSSILQNVDRHSDKIADMSTSSLVYPFSLVSTIMATSGSRLHTATNYIDWRDCMHDLKIQKEHHRGSSIIFGRKITKIEAAMKMAAFSLMMKGEI